MREFKREERTRKGMIGEYKVKLDLLEKGWDLYEPVIDDGGGIDLIAITENATWSIQVKYHHHIGNSKGRETKTSRDIRVKPTPADYIAIPMLIGEKEHILYYPHFGKSYGTKHGIGICIAVEKSKHNQLKGINWWEDFLILPREELK